MARTDPQVNIRVPAALIEGLKSAATENNRSFNAEIVARLEASFETRSLKDVLLEALKEFHGR